MRRPEEQLSKPDPSFCIVGSVQHLYEVRSPTAATLILLFSVVVPLAKAATVFVALFLVGAETRRRRLLQFVEAIAKWS